MRMLALGEAWGRCWSEPAVTSTAIGGGYAKVFATVELSTTFYRLPSPEAVDGWRQNIRVSK